MIIAFSGRIGKDAETRTTQGGERVTSFSVGCNIGRDKTQWIDCAMFGERGEKLAPYLKKGTPVGINGRPSARAYIKDGDARAILGCAVNHVDLLGSKSDGGERQQSGGYGGGGYGGAPAPQGGPSDLDDEIPFAREWR